MAICNCKLNLMYKVRKPILEEKYTFFRGKTPSKTRRIDYQYYYEYKNTEHKIINSKTAYCHTKIILTVNNIT